MIRFLVRALALVTGLAALAVLLLLAMKLRPGEGRNDADVEIARPPEVVFAYLVEPAKLRQWIGWLTDVRPEAPGPDGAPRDVWVMADPKMRQPMLLRNRFTALEPPRVLEVETGVPGTFLGTIRYELTALDGGRTRLTYRSHFTYGPWLFKLLEPLVTPQAQKKLVDDLGKLKAAAEAGG